MYDKVAVIGDWDLIFPLKAVGIRIFSPGSTEEAREVLKSLEKDDIAICFLHQKYFEALHEEREALGRKFCPVVAGFSDYRTITDHLAKMMRDMAVKATGSDSLVKKR